MLVSLLSFTLDVIDEVTHAVVVLNIDVVAAAVDVITDSVVKHVLDVADELKEVADVVAIVDVTDADTFDTVEVVVVVVVVDAAVELF